VKSHDEPIRAEVEEPRTAQPHGDPPRDENDEEKIVRADPAIGNAIVSLQGGQGEAVLVVTLENGWRLVVVRSEDAISQDLPVWEVAGPPENGAFILYDDGTVDHIPGDEPIPTLIETGRLHHWPTTSAI
jgi:hypothetical protein